VPHAEQVWESATLEESYRKGAGFLKICTESGSLKEVKLKADGSDLPPLRNPAILVGQVEYYSQQNNQDVQIYLFLLGPHQNVYVHFGLYFMITSTKTNLLPIMILS